MANGDVNTIGASLNERLALALGWRVIERRFVGGFYYELVKPGGGLVAHPIARTPQEAWQHAPDFVGSVDATLATLPLNDGHLYDVRIVQFLAGGFGATIIRDTPPLGTQKRWTARGVTRAAALANARLAMALAQQEAGT